MLFVKSKRGFINAEYIVRVNKTDGPDTVIIEYHTARAPSANSDHTHSTTFCHIDEMKKIGLDPSDFDGLGAREF